MKKTIQQAMFSQAAEETPARQPSSPMKLRRLFHMSTIRELEVEDRIVYDDDVRSIGDENDVGNVSDSARVV